MSVGETVYTSDDRVLVSHRDDSADWVLQFKFVRERDEGIYECQVGCNVVCKVYILCLFQVTMSNGQVKSRSVHLDVVTPEAIILSTDEYCI